MFTIPSNSLEVAKIVVEGVFKITLESRSSDHRGRYYRYKSSQLLRSGGSEVHLMWNHEASGEPHISSLPPDAILLEVSGPIDQPAIDALKATAGVRVVYEREG
jgi:hypothetical protein